MIKTLKSLLFLSTSICSAMLANDCSDFTATRENLQQFAHLYQKRPIKNNSGGMKSVGMFWVWLVTKTIQPDLIVESGIWNGQSTWLLEQAAPNAKIISIDPLLEQRKYISKKVIYYREDFSLLDFGDISNLKTLCFFDDHQDAFRRTMQASKFGFQHLLFDDNYPSGCGSHRTLAHCFEKEDYEHNYLASIIEKYTIFPQIFGSSVQTGDGTFTIKSLGITLDDSIFDIYKKDANSYRWTTYVKLKGK